MTIRELKEIINSISEEYLDGEVFLISNSCKTFCYDEEESIFNIELVKEDEFTSNGEAYTSEERDLILDLYSRIKDISPEEKIDKLNSIQLWCTSVEEADEIITDIVEFMFQSRKKGTLLIS